ncbi:MAG: AraC family transcriptional regulator [Victivallales bacterium]|nr:AraC family transcriptional regulator [Victivallales bacterium]
MKTYRAETYFQDGMEFSIRHAINLAKDFPATSRHKREFWKITYIVHGSGRAVINNGRYAVQDGSILLVHPDAETTWDMDSEAYDVYNLLFSSRFIETELKSLRDSHEFFTIFSREFSQDQDPSIYVQTATPSIRRRVMEIFDEYNIRPLNYKAYIKSSLVLLLIQMLRESGRTFRTNHHLLPEYIMQYMQKNLCATTSTTTFASNFGITPNHLCLLFKNATGKTISQARIETRLEAAAERLRNCNDGILDICFSCGFKDVSYFYRAFHARYQLTPKQYRAKYHT